MCEDLDESVKQNPSFRAALAAAIAAHDRSAALDLALDGVDGDSISIDNLYGLLSELLVEVGAGWLMGTTEVWQEHHMTGIVRTIVENMALRVERAAPAVRGGAVVLSAPPDEHHELGLRMLTDRFTLCGWRAHFLGANVPLPDLVAAVDDLSANAVAVSASTHFHRVKLKQYIEGLAEARPQLRIWVGGPAFNIERSDWPHEMVLDGRAIPQPEEE